MNEKSLIDGDVILEINKGIGVIEFDHPKSNSLPGKVLKKLAEKYLPKQIINKKKRINCQLNKPAKRNLE